MSGKQAKNVLVIVWFVGSGLLFSVLILQSLFRFSPTEREAVWSLFLPSIVPTLTLIIGVLVTETLGQAQPQAWVMGPIFSLTLFLSALYLVAIGLPIFLSPFSDETPIALLRASQLWMVPLQGLTSAALGAFFVHKPK